jgi:hypothetical protein
MCGMKNRTRIPQLKTSDKGETDEEHQIINRSCACTQEAEAGELWIPGQPRLHMEILFFPSKKKKKR